MQQQKTGNYPMIKIKCAQCAGHKQQSPYNKTLCKQCAWFLWQSTNDKDPKKRSMAAQRWNNPELRKYANLKKYFPKYGIEHIKSIYLMLLERQDNKCAICKVDASTLKKALFVDHDHTTNHVRGLLCHNCNIVLGMAKDSQNNLTEAVEYLKRN